MVSNPDPEVRFNGGYTVWLCTILPGLTLDQDLPLPKWMFPLDKEMLSVSVPQGTSITEAPFYDLNTLVVSVYLSKAQRY